MPAQIRPNRLDVTDRFPMLGFTIRTDGTPQRAEIAIAATPDLFRPEHKNERTASNFYSSRAAGPLMVPRGEAVYIVPAEVLARFVGQERIYFALATAPESNGTPPRIDVLPDAGSPYVQLRGLTSRSLRRVRLVPSRQERASGYGTNGGASLDWAGDKATPGAVPVPAGNGKAAAPAPPSTPDYDDGFGPLPAPSQSAPAAGGASNGTAAAGGNGKPVLAPPPGAASPATSPAAQSLGVRALDASDLTISADRQPVKPPSVTRLPAWQASLAQGAVTALGGPLAPVITALPAAARVAGVSIGVGPAVSGGLGAGVGLGAGLVFGPDGGIGVYGAAEFEVGFLASVSATAQVTVVNGGIESFNGWGMAASISGGEGVVGGASALFDLNGNFQGVSFQLGVGAGLTPVDFYVAVQRGVAVQLAYMQSVARAQAIRTLADDTVGASADDPSTQSIEEPIPDDAGTAVAAASLGYARAQAEAPEYPQASRFAPAAPTNYRHVSGARDVKRVVIHITDGQAKISGTIGWFQNPNQLNSKGKPITVSAHYVVGRDGEVVQMVHHNDIAWHAGRANGDSIGIEHCANKRGLDPTEPQYAASAALVQFLCGCYGIPFDRDHIVGHKEADPSTSHDCPSRIWDWDHYMDLVLAQAPDASTAQALSQSRTLRSRPRAMGTDSFSINWDEVEAIPQPTDVSCWAAAGAMVVGWKEQVSLSPEALGTICRRTTTTGLDPAQVGQFAKEIGLAFEPPQCYSVEGFRRLLENYGPLWVAADVPGLHAIVVTGLYSDGARTLVRITDPWDRTVGTPGAPGPYQQTHATGSRYIMTWEDFVKEYERAATDYSSVNLQILHADSTAGRTPNYGPATSAGYAQGLGARALADDSFSINWDEVQSIAQPTDVSCWATAAAMVVGWRDSISLSPESVADMSGRTTATGLDPAQVGQFAQEMGLTAEPPQSYTIDGFRNLLEKNGPLWVGAAVPGLHAIVVTGLYADGSNTYVRITDPWDRTVGTPGAPGGYLDTHASGSRYIMKWEDFVKEYEAAATNYASVNLQILHSGGALGRTPNYGSAATAGYAQALRSAKAAARPMARSTRRYVAAQADGPAPTGDAAAPKHRRESGSAGAARWTLDQYDGLRRPAGAVPSGTATLAVNAISLDNWPLVRLHDGDVKLPLMVSWRHGGGQVGDVMIRAGEPGLVPGWSIAASADITDGPDTASNAAVTVTLRQVFSQAGKPDIVASTELMLWGDGTYQRRDAWLQATAA